MSRVSDITRGSNVRLISIKPDREENQPLYIKTPFILVIAADYTDEYEAKDMLKAFLETKFDNKKRHTRRLKEIEKIEANN